MSEVRQSHLAHGCYESDRATFSDGFALFTEPDRKARVIKILAIGHRREVYDEIADQLREGEERK